MEINVPLLSERGNTFTCLFVLRPRGTNLSVFRPTGTRPFRDHARGPEEHQALSPNGHFSTEAPEIAKMDDFLIKEVSKV